MSVKMTTTTTTKKKTLKDAVMFIIKPRPTFAPRINHITAGLNHSRVMHTTGDLCSLTVAAFCTTSFFFFFFFFKQNRIIDYFPFNSCALRSVLSEVANVVDKLMKHALIGNNSPFRFTLTVSDKTQHI